MGVGDAPTPVRRALRLMITRRLPVFPLPGAVLFPGMHLPLHIFEPRYRAMIGEALARDRMIGMVQPRGDGDSPPLFAIGGLGRMVEVEALDDGRFNILLEGVSRFEILSELDVVTPFRQVQAALWVEDETVALASVERASLEEESRRFADIHGYAVDWDQVSRLDDVALVNGIAQIAPFDPAARQALLETRGLQDRAALIVQLMQFFGRREEPGGAATLQ